MSPDNQALPSSTPPVPAPNIAQTGGNKQITLPNGKVGEPYEFRFAEEVFGSDALVNVDAGELTVLGLDFEPSTRLLTGRPLQAGQHELRLLFQYEGSEEGRPQLTRRLSWYVNPDPRTLWTEQEPEEGSTQPKSHTDSLMDTSGPKTMVAASRRGRSHAKDGKFREDDFRCSYLSDAGWYVLTVADGAGSAAMAREGSRLACETVSQEVSNALTTGKGDELLALIGNVQPEQSSESERPLKTALYELLGGAALAATRQITQCAESAGLTARDYATTLLTAICRPVDTGWFIGAFWIGDGGLGIFRKEEGVRLMGEPDGGEYSGQTRFLTMKETFEPEKLYGRIRYELVPDFDALILMTDGITDAWFQTDANLAKAEQWDALLTEIGAIAPLRRDNPEVATQLLEWLNFWVKGEYDDRTLAILF
jgi:serine/threonine protein phosphatase PrpC